MLFWLIFSHFCNKNFWYIMIILLFDISFVRKVICLWMWETIMKNLPFLAITNDTDLPIIKNVLIIIKSISGNNERCKTSPFQFFEWCGFTKKVYFSDVKKCKKEMRNQTSITPSMKDRFLQLFEDHYITTFLNL